MSKELERKYDNNVSPNTKYQQRDRDYRKNSREILDLNGTVTKMKNSQEGFLQFPLTAVTIYYKLGGIKLQKFIFSEFWMPEV